MLLYVRSFNQLKILSKTKKLLILTEKNIQTFTLARNELDIEKVSALNFRSFIVLAISCFGITLRIHSLKSFLFNVIWSVYLNVTEFILNDVVNSEKVFSYLEDIHSKTLEFSSFRKCYKGCQLN